MKKAASVAAATETVEPTAVPEAVSTAMAVAVRLKSHPSTAMMVKEHLTPVQQQDLSVALVVIAMAAPRRLLAWFGWLQLARSAPLGASVSQQQ